MSAQKERQQQREAAIHQRNISHAQGAQSLLEQRNNLLTDLIETELSEGKRNLLENLQSGDFVLGNFNEAELNELRFELEIIRDMYFTSHPPEECVITGDFAKYCYDDPDAGAQSLSTDEQLQAMQFFRAIIARITRAREMKQQEMFSKTITESRHEKAGGGGGGSGIIGRWRS